MIKRIIDKETRVFIRDDFTFDEETEIGLDVAPAQGLYAPKWDGKKWIEAGQAPEPTPREPTELELLMLAIAELDMQRELDRTENQIAIAELAESLLGGI